ncbi:MAG: hypothetical protein GY853_01880 [PVC group bacterium]|nr:hypothetical protein [PVC group bacterium]
MNILKGFAKDIVIRFTADTARLTQGLNKVKQEIRGLQAPIPPTGIRPQGISVVGGVVGGALGMGGIGQTAIKKSAIEKEAKEASAALKSTSDRFATLRQGLNSSLLPLGQFSGLLRALPGWLKVAIVGIVGLKKTFHYGSIIEQSKMVLESIYGNEAQAVRTIKGMRDFSRRTQFLPETIVGGTTMLAKYGVNPFEKNTYGLKGGKTAMDLMAGLAAMPGMGGQPIGLDRAVNAAIAGRDIRPLKALGPEVLAAYQKARDAGISGSPEYIRVMLTELAKLPKILRLANAQMFTMSGMWSTITGFAEEIFMDIAGAGQREGVLTFWSQLKEILFEIRTAGESFIISMQPFFQQFGVFLGVGFKAVFEVIKSAFIILAPFFSILKEVLKIFFQIGTFLGQTFIKTLKFLMEVIGKAFEIFGANGFVTRAIDMLYQFSIGLQVTFKFWGLYIDWLFLKISNNLDGIFAKFKLFKPLWEGFQTIGRFMSPTFNQAIMEGADPKYKEESEKAREQNWETLTDIYKWIDDKHKALDEMSGGFNKLNVTEKNIEKVSKGIRDGIGDLVEYFTGGTVAPISAPVNPSNAPGGEKQ